MKDKNYLSIARILGLCEDLTEMKYLVYSYDGNPEHNLLKMHLTMKENL